jgi:septal ring factor EnvC (AmiA/AmiB activator)
MNKFLIYSVIALSALLFAAWQQGSIETLESEIALIEKDNKELSLQKEALAAELIESEAAKKRLADDVRRLDKILVEREAKLLSSKKELAGLSKTLNELRETNAEFKDWSDIRVPDSVIRLLNDARTAGDSKN